MFTAHDGLPLYVGQTNENPAQTGTSQQRPNDVNPTVSLYTAETANGTGVQYLLPTTARNFPLQPTGLFFIGSGASRTQVLPVSIGHLGRTSRARTWAGGPEFIDRPLFLATRDAAVHSSYGGVQRIES